MAGQCDTPKQWTKVLDGAPIANGDLVAWAASAPMEQLEAAWVAVLIESLERVGVPIGQIGPLARFAAAVRDRMRGREVVDARRVSRGGSAASTAAMSERLRALLERALRAAEASGGEPVFLRDMSDDASDRSRLAARLKVSPVSGLSVGRRRKPGAIGRPQWCVWKEVGHG